MARLQIAAALFLACAAAAAASALPSNVVRHETHEGTAYPKTTMPAEGASTSMPAEGASTTMPAEGSTTMPAEGASTTMPAEGSSTSAEGASPVVGAPAAGGTKDAEDDPVDADATTEPSDEEEDGATGDSTDEDDGDGVCFPGDATVELQSGEIVPMHKLSIGDSVKVGAGKYSTVFMFTHKLHDIAYDYVTLRTASGATLSLTKGHYLYASGALVAAGSVAKGDVLTLGEGGSSAVVEVGTRSGHGLFNPQTLHGDVVVNGIVSSTYTTAVAPGFAHAVLAPLRALSGVGLRFTGLESGAQTFVGVVPGSKVEL